MTSRLAASTAVFHPTGFAVITQIPVLTVALVHAYVTRFRDVLSSDISDVDGN